jgi:hypothetical protein
MCHDLLFGHHDRDYRCRAAFLLRWFARVVLAFMRISYDGDVLVERVVGKDVQEADVDNTAHWWMTIHRGHARAVYFDRKATRQILFDLKEMGRPPLDLASTGWHHMLNASQDRPEEEVSVPSAELEKCQFCADKRTKHISAGPGGRSPAALGDGACSPS